MNNPRPDAVEFGATIASGIVRRGELHVFRARPRKLARAGADVRGTCGVCRSLDAQLGPCSRPARRTVPSKMRFVPKSGLGVRPGARSLDRGRAPHNSFLSRNSATGEAGMDGGVLFLGRRPQLVLAGLPRRRPVYARGREMACQGRALSRQNRQSGPEIRGVRRRVETLGARASEMRRRRHRCDRPRNTDEFACPKSAWRGLQPRPGSSGGPRSRQQSPTAAAGFVCFAYGAGRRSSLCANRRRSRRSTLASG